MSEAETKTAGASHVHQPGNVNEDGALKKKYAVTPCKWLKEGISFFGKYFWTSFFATYLWGLIMLPLVAFFLAPYVIWAGSLVNLIETASNYLTIDNVVAALKNYSLLSIVSSFTSASTSGFNYFLLFYILSILYQALMCGPARAAYFVPVLNKLHGERVHLSLFFGGFRFFFTLLIQQFIETVIVTIGLSLFILPGIYAMVVMWWTVPLIVDRKYGPFKAIGVSFMQVHRNCCGSLLLLITIAGVSFLFIGGLVLLFILSLFVVVPALLSSFSLGVFLLFLFIVLGAHILLFFNIILRYTFAFAYDDVCGIKRELLPTKDPRSG